MLNPVMPTTAMPVHSGDRWRRVACFLSALSAVGYIAWGGAAALFLEHLVGPGGVPILPAGYAGYTHDSWQALAATSPHVTNYMTVLFRMYGTFNVLFGFMALAITVTAFRRGETWAWWTLLVGNTIAYGSAMTYDQIVNAVGPFEMMEYLGLAIVYVALALTAPFRASARHNPQTGRTPPKEEP